MQLIGEMNQIMDQEQIEELRITEDQIEQLNAVKSGNLKLLFDERRNNRSGDPAIQFTKNTYQGHLACYHVLNAKQRKKWDAKIGQRLTEDEFVQLHQEYRERTR